MPTFLFMTIKETKQLLNYFNERKIKKPLKHNSLMKTKLSCGQISIDLLITLIIVIIIISSFGAVALNMHTNQEIAFAENQLKNNTAKTAAFIVAAQAMMDTQYNATIPIQQINYNSQSFFPEITINEKEIIFGAKSNGIEKEFVESIPIGQKISIKNNYLVVTNE